MLNMYNNGHDSYPVSCVQYTLQHATRYDEKNDKAFKLLLFLFKFISRKIAFVSVKTKLKFQNCNVNTKINF